ncbi:GNAT family N-acetyltransferase [Marinigracilibium pacificum]|uniref:GNAT family N-acetyltransferase n=1 Tax=Marinigracilibium pacificum TaxID=2729599 RepID=A0A848IRK6_9BACT|nr:GNAT family N-acetyltransferase [Marinigracilibium pacificum]NMM46987.1 GNAT family N-acetyltransferase [Marinigracilibium pacificum]
MTETTFTVINKDTGENNSFSNDAIATFLRDHLDEFGDKKEDILKAIEYVFNRGGNVVVAADGSKIVGAVVINNTGMSGYIPENILVYIAVHADKRGAGLGKKLMQEAINITTGDIALHVEPHNPAKFLYEKLGFTNKYLEMRLQNK